MQDYYLFPVCVHRNGFIQFLFLWCSGAVIHYSAIYDASLFDLFRTCCIEAFNDGRTYSTQPAAFGWRQ